MKDITLNSHIPYYGEDTAPKKESKPIDKTK